MKKDVVNLLHASFKIDFLKNIIIIFSCISKNHPLYIIYRIILYTEINSKI